jgi:hypothetical protein
MNSIRKCLASLAAGAILVGLSGCLPTPAKDNPGDRKPVEPPPVAQFKPAPNLKPLLPKPPAPAKDTVTVTIYRADSFCEKLVPEQVAVSDKRTLEAAVGEVLKHWESSGDFNLAGYRINVDSQQATATVDLRLSPNSRRQMVSLSSCEQFSLFGSLRKTLTHENPQWQIKNVRFTERGKDIVL